MCLQGEFDDLQYNAHDAVCKLKPLLWQPINFLSVPARIYILLVAVNGHFQTQSLCADICKHDLVEANSCVG